MKKLEKNFKALKNLWNLKKLINSFALSSLVSSSLFSNTVLAVSNFEAKLEKLGFSSNYSSAGVVEGQMAGYASGGSIIVKGGVTNTQLANIALPSLKAGCGGINLFGGGFSYINMSQIEDLLRNVAQGSVGFSVMLAMDHISPEIGNLIKTVESMARGINGQNINSCQMAAGIVAGLAPKTEQAERMACNARSMDSNAVADFFTARYNCSNEDKMNDTNSKSKNAANMKSLLGTEYNLVAKALQDAGINDRETIGMLMSVSGTYISKRASNGLVTDFRPSLVTTEDRIQSFLKGDGQTALYQCNDDACLNPTIIQTDASLAGKLSNVVENVIAKIKDDLAGKGPSLTEEEKSIGQMISIPFFHMITSEIVLTSGPISVASNEYIDAMSMDIVTNYLEKMLEIVHTAVTNLESAQIDGSKIELFRKEIKTVRNSLNVQKDLALKRLSNKILTAQRAEFLRKQVHLKFDQLINYTG